MTKRFSKAMRAHQALVSTHTPLTVSYNAVFQLFHVPCCALLKVRVFLNYSNAKADTTS